MSDNNRNHSPQKIFGFTSLLCLAALAFTRPLCGQQALSMAHEKHVPIYRLDVVGRTIPAMNYLVRATATHLQFQGTPLAATARGEASIYMRNGVTHIAARFAGLVPANELGPLDMTYVLWAITPSGVPHNLGEVELLHGVARLRTATNLQAFGLVVTAEPDFAVSRPSNTVVLQNAPTPRTTGAEEQVRAHYHLLLRAHYLRQAVTRPPAIPVSLAAPLDYFEAENALRIARWAGAPRYAHSLYAKAQAEFDQARLYVRRRAGLRPVGMMARAAVQTAEDARLLSLRRQRQLKLRRQTRQQEAALRAARRQSRAAARRARAAALRAARARSQVVAVRYQQARLRARLRRQLQMIMATRATAQGLIMNMPGLLFASGSARLTPAAKIKLAKVAGALAGYPGLWLTIRGYTDDSGSPEMNRRLSLDRAAAVQEFLIQQGVSPARIQARGEGDADPIASNRTARGREQNRRVEVLLSGGMMARTISSQ